MELFSCVCCCFSPSARFFFLTGMLGWLTSPSLLCPRARVAAREARRRFQAKSRCGPSSERILHAFRQRTMSFFGTTDLPCCCSLVPYLSDVFFMLLLRNTSAVFRIVLLRHSSVFFFFRHASVLVWPAARLRVPSCCFCAAAYVYFSSCLCTLRFSLCSLRFASSLICLRPLSCCSASASQILLELARFLVLLQFMLLLFWVQSGLGVLPSRSMLGAHSTHPPLRHPVPQRYRRRLARLRVCVDSPSLCLFQHVDASLIKSCSR